MSELKEYGTQEGDIVMPFYIVCDVSGSMHRDIPTLEASLRELQQSIKDAPAIADIVQVGIITFADDGRVDVPLGHLEEAAIPSLATRGGTNYGAAFKTLRAAIDADRGRLKGQGFQVYRPCAFFLTDGEPTDDPKYGHRGAAWYQTFAEQFHFDPESGTGNRAYPRFIPFGFRDATLDVLSKLAYPAKGGKAFIQRDGATVKTALEAIIPYLGQTIIATGMSATGAGDGKPQHVVPQELEGFESADSQYVGGDWL